jgi:hypothetical protein
MIRMMITFRKSNKDLPERRAGVYQLSRKRNTINYDHNKIKVNEVGVVCNTRGRVE